MIPQWYIGSKRTWTWTILRSRPFVSVVIVFKHGRSIWSQSGMIFEIAHVILNEGLRHHIKL